MNKERIKIGDLVYMNDTYAVATENLGRLFTVASDSFNLCGTQCVMLENYSGAYALDGLTNIGISK